MNTPQEVLEKGIEILERDGWHQGALYRTPEPGRLGPHRPEVKVDAHREAVREYHEADIVAAETAPVCAMGAVYRAVYGTCKSSRMKSSVKSLKLFEGAMKLLNRSLPEGGNMPAWNDDPARTAEDVILAFKVAAHGS